jgi:uncharacterized protein
MSYAKSKYNIIQQDIDGNYVLYNCLSNSYCIVRKRDDLEKMMSGEPIDHVLIEKGFLVEEEHNEIALAEYYLNKKINPDFLNLFIVPTRFCNFDCVYCYEEHKPLYMSRETQDKVLLFIKNNLSKYSGLIITWFGGEPTVALKAVEYLSVEIKKICSDLKKPYYAAINTNGYELTPDVMERFLSYNIRYFQICIDGVKHTHEKHRRHIKNGDSYDKIINNLIGIKSNIKRGFKIVIRTNVTKKILDVMDEYIVMLYSHFGGDDRFWYYWEIAKDHGGDRVKNIFETLLPDENKFIEYVIKASKLGMKFDFNQFVAPGGFVCALYPYNYWLIDYNGDVQKCTVNFESDVKLGKLHGSKIKIDETSLARWMYSNKSNCKECPIYPACGASSCPFGEKDKCKFRDCNHLRSIFNNIVMMNYYNKKEIEAICII